MVRPLSQYIDAKTVNKKDIGGLLVSKAEMGIHDFLYNTDGSS